MRPTRLVTDPAEVLREMVLGKRLYAASSPNGDVWGMDDGYRFWPVSVAVDAVDAMKAQGWIEVHPQTYARGESRAIFKLTEAGREAARAEGAGRSTSAPDVTDEPRADTEGTR